jgi:hypothetical protein
MNLVFNELIHKQQRKPTPYLRNCRVLILQPEVAGEAKLNGLLALYSSCSTAPARYMVLLQTLEFAKQSKQLAALLVPVVKVRGDLLLVSHFALLGSSRGLQW